jgi:Xaa-Pro aminopeptidase
VRRYRSEVSQAELERRWSRVRAAMRQQGLDVLVMQNDSDWVGGMVRWFTDVPATAGYPRTVLFFADRPMTVVEMGPFGGRRRPAADDPGYRGVERVLTTPAFVSVAYTHAYEPALVLEALAEAGARHVGLVNPGALPHALTKALQERFVEWVDASDLVDTIKAVKSPEEIDLLRRAAALQDEVFAATLDFIRPGVRDIDVANHAQAVAHRLGSDQGILLGTSARVGLPTRFAGRQFQGRQMAQGDHFTFLIEVSGPGGMYVEVARTLVLGTASDKLLDTFECVREAQAHTLSLMRPGAVPAQIAHAHDDWLAARGLPLETRLYAHGQGVDLVERPLIRHDETLPLAEGMCMVVHPSFDDPEVFAVVCDNYLVERDGMSACLHRTEQKIFEVPCAGR